MTRLRAAVVGTGFMARAHLEALRRIGSVDVAALVGRRADRSRALAEEFDVERVETDYAALLGAPDIQAIHICTPNALHFPMASAALNAGKHVLCEKPLATTSADAAALVTLASATSLQNATCYNLRAYPMVQQMRRMRESGLLGDILIAQGTYSQDWLLYDTDTNWRVDAREGGALRVVGDIGTHWCDMAEHITGLRIASLCADVATFHTTRNGAPVETEDFGALMFQLGHRARGTLTVSQVSAGRKNQLRIEIYGTKASVSWDQESPEELWIGHRDAPNQVLKKDPSLLFPEAAAYADYPGGHAEGYSDTFKQMFRRFYQSIRDPRGTHDYPRFADGLRQMRILDTALASHRARGWIDVAND
jgi:predicted dehydrogenase